MTAPNPLVRPLDLPDPLPSEGPLVSIILPLYNYRQYIEESLRSILEQAYRSFEVIILDDCSTDGSWELACSIAERDSRIALHRNPTHSGIYETVLRLLDLANGPLLKDFSADDRFHDANNLASLVAAIESDPEIVLATGWRELIDQSGFPLDESRQEPHLFAEHVVVDGRYFGDISLSLNRNYIGDIQVLSRTDAWSREQFLKIGGIDPGPLLAGTDILTWLNMLCHGKAAYLNQTLAQLRIHSMGQVSRGIQRNPLWPEGQYKLIQGARNLGFLSDESLYRKGLVTLLDAELGDIDGFVEENPGEWDRCEDFLHRLIDEIIELSSKT